MQPALAIEQLSKTYDGGFQALKDISLSVQPGDFFALLGPNGAGKSTTIGIICSLVLKTGGKVSIFGHDIDKDFSQAKQLVGVVPQEFNFNQFEKPIDILIHQAGYFGIPRDVAIVRAEKYLRQLGLWDKSHVPSRTLSGGMKRRLMIARALIHEPKLLVLDEPTAGVDIELRRSMWEFLREINASGTTIILTTHYLEEAEELCDRIAIINRGQVIACDDTRALVARLDKKELRITVTEPLTALPGGLSRFTVELPDDQNLVFRYRTGETEIRDILAAISDAGLRIADLSTEEPDLEDVFLELTREASGDV